MTATTEAAGSFSKHVDFDAAKTTIRWGMRNGQAIDARTFQKPLGELAEVLAQKMKREAPKLLAGPGFIAIDQHVLIRQAMRTYDLLFYLYADERRETDCHWRPEYNIITLPLIRNMIDCLYNITVILQDASRNAPWFRKSSYKQVLRALDEDQARYGGQPEWDAWIAEKRDRMECAIRVDGLTVDEVLKERPWPTLGKYLSQLQPGRTLTPHQSFLKTFAYGHWREYSAMAHAMFEGLVETAGYYVTDSMRHEDRPKIDEAHPRDVSMHIARAAAILLSIVTELQAHFHFEDARLNERVNKMWDALMPVFEVTELYRQRYEGLMKDQHIDP